MKATSLTDFYLTENRRHKFPKGSMVVTKGDSLERTYYIAEGIVKVYVLDAYGDTRTLALFGRGAIFPVAWVLKEIPERGAIYYYEALTEVTLYVTSREKVRDFLASRPDLAMGLLDIMGNIYVNTVARVQMLQRSNVAERVEFILYYLAKVLGDFSQDGKTAILPFNLTHQVVAELAGLSRETVTHQLNRANFKAMITKGAGITTVHLDKIDEERMPLVNSLRLPERLASNITTV